MASKDHDTSVKAAEQKEAEPCKVATEQQKLKVRKQREAQKLSAQKRNAKYKLKKNVTPNKDVVAKIKADQKKFKELREKSKGLYKELKFESAIFSKDKSGKVIKDLIQNSSFPSCKNKNVSSFNKKQRKNLHDQIYKAEKSQAKSRKVQVSSPSKPIKLSAEKAKARSAKSAAFRSLRQKNKGQYKRKTFSLGFKSNKGQKVVENGWSIPPANYPRSQQYVKKIFDKFDKNKIGYTSAQHVTSLPTALGIPDSKFAEFEKFCVSEKKIYEGKVLEFLVKLMEPKKDAKKTERSNVLPCLRSNSSSSKVDSKKALAEQRKKLKAKRKARLQSIRSKKAKLSEEKESSVLIEITFKNNKQTFDITDYEAPKVSAFQQDQLSAVWGLFDKEGAGKLDDKTFSAFLKHIGVRPKKKNFGLSKKGFVEYTDFADAWFNSEVTSTNVRASKNAKFLENTDKARKVRRGKYVKKIQKSPRKAKRPTVDELKLVHLSDRLTLRKSMKEGARKYRNKQETLTIYSVDASGHITTNVYKSTKHSSYNLFAYEASKGTYFGNAWAQVDPNGTGKISQSKFAALCTKILGLPATPRNQCNRRIVNLHEAFAWFGSATSEYKTNKNKICPAKRSKVLATKKSEADYAEKLRAKNKLQSDEEVHKCRVQARKKWANVRAKNKALRKTKLEECKKAKQNSEDEVFITWVKAPTKNEKKVRVQATYSPRRQKKCLPVSSILKKQVEKVIYKSGNETGLYSKEDLKTYYCGDDKVLSKDSFKNLEAHFKDSKTVTEDDIQDWWLTEIVKQSKAASKGVPCAPPSPGKRMKKKRSLPSPTKKSKASYMSRKQLKAHQDKCQLESQKKLEESRAQRNKLKTKYSGKGPQPSVQLFFPKATQSIS